MRISDWSSDVCSSDLELQDLLHDELHRRRISLDGDPHGLETQCLRLRILDAVHSLGGTHRYEVKQRLLGHLDRVQGIPGKRIDMLVTPFLNDRLGRSEEHPSERQYLMRISYAVFCLKQKY